MSSIAFHSPTRTVYIHGPERGHANSLCLDTLEMALGVHHEWDLPSQPSRLRALIPPSWITTSTDFMRDFKLYIRVDSEHTFILPDGTGEIRCWYAALNTAIKLGPDPLRFLARVDAQCEIHGYVEGQHRSWLADIVEQGLKMNILRRAYDGSAYKNYDNEWWGWQKLIQMLNEDDKEPVVMSHSVTDTFPSRWMIEDSISEDEWYSLSDQEQWNKSMIVLRELNKQNNLEMKPDTFAEIHYEMPITGFDIRSQLDNNTSQPTC